jgi:hypothetical protein
MWIIISDLGDGYDYFGPFDEVEIAEEWASHNLNKNDWWLAVLTNPTE